MFLSEYKNFLKFLLSGSSHHISHYSTLIKRKSTSICIYPKSSDSLKYTYNHLKKHFTLLQPLLLTVECIATSNMNFIHIKGAFNCHNHPRNHHTLHQPSILTKKHTTASTRIFTIYRCNFQQRKLT